jgi:uncharacterized protein (UPF0261 family)
MEAFADEGMFAAVLDWTTTEFSNSMFGPGRDAGTRLRSGRPHAVPRVVVPGATDILTLRAPLPERYADRLVHWHLPEVALVRLSPAEARAVGAEIGSRAASYAGPIGVVVPMGGFSALSAAGAPLADPEADLAWLEGLRGSIGEDVEVEVVDAAINDPATAAAAVAATLRLMDGRA